MDTELLRSKLLNLYHSGALSQAEHSFLLDALPRASALGLKAGALPASFNQKWRLSATTGCWEWIAGTNAIGYGRYRWGGSDEVGGKVYYAHRFSFEVWFNRDIEGLVIDHLCENKSCVNPHHLDDVTMSENIRRIYKR